MDVFETLNPLLPSFHDTNNIQAFTGDYMYRVSFPPIEEFTNNPVYSYSDMQGLCNAEEEKKEKRAKVLSQELISQYFYLPLTQAAKELEVGVTLLKKRCRELGISRWPHRKLMSIQTVIKNVENLSKEEEKGGHQTNKKLRDHIKILEYEKKLIEKIPNIELKEKTKKLRQACIKANYDKRNVK